MTPESMVMFVTLLLVTGGSGHVISSAAQPPMLEKMEEITEHLRALTSSMGELDRELKEALLMDGIKNDIAKRSSARDDDGVNCRLHLREDICQVWELMKDRADFIHSPSSPGKSSVDETVPNYYQLAADLKKKREVIHTLNDVFNNAGHILEREKKWMTCKLNLGFTCQTQEYSNIADYYDFLNSPESPGKKRSVPDMSDKS